MGCYSEPLELERDNVEKLLPLQFYFPVAPSQLSSEKINDPSLEALLFFLSGECELSPRLGCI